MKKTDSPDNDSHLPEKSRPFLLSILCFVVFVYSTVFVLIFSVIALFNNWFRFILIEYLSVPDIKKSFILALATGGIVLYGLSFLSGFLMWRLKRTGFILFILSSAAIALIPYFFGLGSLINIILFTLLSLGFTFFLRKFK